MAASAAAGLTVWPLALQRGSISRRSDSQTQLAIGTNLSGMEWANPGLRRGLSSLPNPWRHRMRTLLTEPPRRFAEDVAALAAAGGVTTHVALTEPGSPVVLPPALDTVAARLEGAE